MRIANVTKQSLNHDLFERLCRARCTNEEIAAFMGVSLPCLRKWCYLFYNQDMAVIKSRFVQVGNADVRLAKLKAVENGNWSAIQWESKLRLGDRDPDRYPEQIEETNDIEDLTPISELLKTKDENNKDANN